MQTLVQLYVFTGFTYIILSLSAKDILSDKLLKPALLLIIYAGIIRIALGLGLQLPFFFHVSVFLAYALFTPGIYLYLRNSIFNQRLREFDFIHVVPFLALCIYSFFAFLLGVDNKNEVSKIWSFTSEHSPDKEAVIPLFSFIYVLTGVYIFLILLLVKKKFALQFDHSTNNEGQENSSPGSIHAVKEESTSQTLLLSPQRMAEIDNIVREVLDEKKPYLRQRYSLKDLSTDTNIPLHHLSAFINKYCGKNFNDFINEFRVMYCKEKIINEEYKYKKLEAIAEESGFNNRNTFAIAFKKITGLNPSEFLKDVKSSHFVNEQVYTIDPSQKILKRVRV